MYVNKPSGSNTKKNDHIIVVVHREQMVNSDFSSTVNDSVENIEAEVGKNVIKK
jgi:hypothetical protein